MDKPVVMIDEPGLVELVAVYMWKSRDGFAYPDERAARYAACTHARCRNCGAPCLKHWLACDGCRDLKERERFDAMPKKPWDGISWLYSQATDKYYETPDDAAEDLEDGATLDDMMLVVCEPNLARRIEVDYFCDDLAEDDDGPPGLQEACDAFNAIIEKLPPLSWSPGDFALDLKETPDAR